MGKETEKQNDLLRSAYSIAQRKGKETNWSAFEDRLREELLSQSGLKVTTDDEQLILRATCTARTFKYSKSFAMKEYWNKRKQKEKDARIAL